MWLLTVITREGYLVVPKQRMVNFLFTVVEKDNTLIRLLALQNHPNYG